GRSADFQRHFCGTHFFNPPRYLELLEIIPTAATLPEVVVFLMDYVERFLGKTPVYCNDTPAFIGNRIGVYSMASVFHYVADSDVSIEASDQLTGARSGRRRLGSVRTAESVGVR